MSLCSIASVLMCVFVLLCLCLYAYLCVLVPLSLCMSLCSYASVFMCVFVFLCLCLYVCLCVLASFSLNAMCWYVICICSITRPQGYKTFLCSTQLSTKFIMLTIVGVLTFISMLNTSSERFKARNFFIC